MLYVYEYYIYIYAFKLSFIYILFLHEYMYDFTNMCVFIYDICFIVFIVHAREIPLFCIHIYIGGKFFVHQTRRVPA